MIVIRKQTDIANSIGVTPEYLLMIKKGTRKLSIEKKVLLKGFYEQKILELKKAIDSL